MTQFFRGTALLIGTVIGAGIFAIPYAVSKIGFLYGSIYIVTLGCAVIMTTLLYGEVVLRTKKREQMTGYVMTYLGIWGKRLVTASLCFGLYGALVAYTLGVGSFLHVLLNPLLGGTPLLYSLIFFAMMAAWVYNGLKTIAGVERVLVGLFIGVVVVICIFAFPFVTTAHLAAPNFTLTDLFLPYGIVLFAFGASASVPGVAELFKQGNHKRGLRAAIITSLGISLLIYLLFAFSVVGVTGQATTEGAIDGLGAQLGPGVLLLGALFGILTMSSGFLTLGEALREVLWLDYKMPPFWAWFFAMSIPLAIVLLRVANFVQVIGIAGAIMGGFDGIVILFMWEKAQTKGDRTPEYHMPVGLITMLLLFLMFTLGIIYQIWFTFFS